MNDLQQKTKNDETTNTNNVSRFSLPTYIFGGALLLFYMGVFTFFPDEMAAPRQRMLAIISALMCGFLGFFITGDILLGIKKEISSNTKLLLKSGGGMALFVLVIIWWTWSPISPIKATNVFHESVIKYKNEINDLRGKYEGAITYRDNPKAYEAAMSKVRNKIKNVADRLNAVPDDKLSLIYTVVKAEYSCYGYALTALVERNEENRIKFAELAIKNGRKALKYIQYVFTKQSHGDEKASDIMDYFDDDHKKNRINYLLSLCYSIKYADLKNDNDLIEAKKAWSEIDTNYKSHFPAGIPQLKNTINQSGKDVEK